MTTTDIRKGTPSVDKPWLKFYGENELTRDLPNDSMYGYLWESRKDHLDKTMMSYMGTKITGKLFFERVNKAAEAFKEAGLKKGDVVTLLSLITPEAIYCIYALNSLGVVINSVYMGMAENEIEETVISTDSKMLITLELGVDKVNAIASKLPVERIIVLSIADSLPAIPRRLYKIKNKSKRFNSDKMVQFSDFVNMGDKSSQICHSADSHADAFIVYTSGSTGTPKGVRLSNLNINQTAFQYGISGMKYNREEVFMTFIPPFLSIGISLAMHTPLCLGMCLDICPDPTPQTVTKHFLKVKPNHFCGDPHNAELIVNGLRGNASYIKNLAAGGASPTKEQEIIINEILKEHGSDAKLVTGYGMTELSATAITCIGHILKPNSLGIPLPFCNIRITSTDNGSELSYGEVGELWISSPGQTKGYVNKDDNKALFGIDEENNIWIKTGDLATVDEDGFVYFKGRLKRIYLKQGADGTPYKIFPQRVEEYIQNIPNVSECAVIVKKHPTLQNIQVAYVAIKAYKDASMVEELLRKACQEGLPDFMVPEKFIIVEELPRLSNGKIDYSSLQKKCADMQSKGDLYE